MVLVRKNKWTYPENWAMSCIKMELDDYVLQHNFRVLGGVPMKVCDRSMLLRIGFCDGV